MFCEICKNISLCETYRANIKKIGVTSSKVFFFFFCFLAVASAETQMWRRATNLLFVSVELFHKKL